MVVVEKNTQFWILTPRVGRGVGEPSESWNQCTELNKMLQIPKWLQQQKCCRSPSDSTWHWVLRAASPRHGRCTRPCHRSPKVAGPGQGTTRRVRDSRLGTPCRVRLDFYLVGCGREGEKKEEQRERKGGERRDRSCLFEREMEKEGIQTSADGRGSGHGLSLKEIEQIIT